MTLKQRITNVVDAVRFETKIRALVGNDPAQAAAVRLMAVELVKNGVLAEDLPGLMYRHHAGPIISIYELQKLREYVNRMIITVSRHEGIDTDEEAAL